MNTSTSYPLFTCSLYSSSSSSLFDAEVAESRTVLHLLDLVNRGYRLPTVPWEPEVEREGGREGGRIVHAGLRLRVARRRILVKEDKRARYLLFLLFVRKAPINHSPSLPPSLPPS
jgi:hypothetical protein